MEWEFSVRSHYIIWDSSVAAKICVGVIQTWIIVEIILKLRLAIKPNPNLQRCIPIGQVMVLILTSIAYVSLVVCVTIDSLEERMEDQIIRLRRWIGYGSLLVFIIMLIANIALILQTRAKAKFDQGQTFSFKKEFTNLMVILLFFGLSYLMRFIVNIYYDSM